MIVDEGGRWHCSIFWVVRKLSTARVRFEVINSKFSSSDIAYVFFKVIEKTIECQVEEDGGLYMSNIRIVRRDDLGTRWEH